MLNYYHFLLDGGGVLKPASIPDIDQWLIGYDGEFIVDKLNPLVVDPEPTLAGVNVLDFTGVTGGGLDFASIVGDETVADFSGTGTEPVISAGRIDCIGTNILHSITLSSGFKFVASAGAELNCYSSNGLDLFAGKEMLAGLEMIDLLEVA